MNKLLSALAAGLSLATASAADYTLHSFQKILVTTNFLCEGADFADFNKDGKKDVVAGPYLFLGPDFKQRVEYTPPAAKPYDPAKDVAKYAHPRSPTTRLHLRPGAFTVFHPQDGHQPGVAVKGPATVLKVVIKFRV